MPRELSAAEAAALVRPVDVLGVPLGPGQPAAFLHALGERDDFERLVVHSALLVDLYPLFTRAGVQLRSGFFGPAERFLRDAGHDVEYVPADFRRFALIAERAKPRVVATAATPPDADGFVSLSLHAGATVEELHRAGRDPDRLVVVETNAQLPRTVGLPPAYPHTLHVDEIDVLVASDRPPFVIADAEPTETERAIAAHALEFVRDGSTIQTGIGGIPSMIATLLAAGSGGDYGIHSEMYTTGLMHLQRSGKVTNQKGVYDGFSVATFAAGTAELYEWLDGNDAVRFLPVDRVNDPAIITRNRDMVTINGALLVDLAGQVAADSIGLRQYSGVGGHEDFVAVSGFETSDRSLICVPSASADAAGNVRPRIVEHLPPGTAVTTPRHQIDVLVTEHGAAELAGMSVRERALAIASLAHPSVRDSLLAFAATR